MNNKPLPRPVSVTDFYLKALLNELQGLRADLTAKPETAPDGLIDLREPAQQLTPLPEAFPGRKELIAAGIEVLENVPRTGKALTAVSGIGPVTANQILTWFKVDQ